MLSNILGKIYLVFCWAFLIFVLTTFSIQGGTESGFTIIDKFVHIFLFGVLTYLLLILFKILTKKLLIVIIFSLILSILYSLGVEYLQNFVPGRISSIFDLSAGVIGSLFAIYIFYRKHGKQKILLHICCAGCGVYISKLLKKDYRVVLYFYNPNIFPKNEYLKRLEECKKLAKKFKLKLIIEKYNHKDWLKKIKGYEKEPERGKRCHICYRDRLTTTAKIAKKNKQDFFATTLTISPHKDAKIINQIGKELEKKYGLKFLDKDFKKQDGFKKSCALSKKLGLYRQNYCGCEFSQRKMHNT